MGRGEAAQAWARIGRHTSRSTARAATGVAWNEDEGAQVRQRGQRSAGAPTACSRAGGHTRTDWPRAGARSWTARARATAVAALAAVLAVPLLATPAPAAAADPTPYTATPTFFSGWLPYWVGDSEVTRLAAGTDMVSEVMAFWLYTKYAGKSRTYPKGITGPTCVHDGSDSAVVECARTTPTTGQRAQLQRLHAAHIKVLPSTTDASGKGVLSGIMKNPKSRAALVSAQVSFVVRNGFDGLDLDYEGFAFRDGSSMAAGTRPGWIAFVTALAKALHAKGKLLSVTVPGDNPSADSGGYAVYAWSQIIGAVDRLRIMTYDYHFDSAGPIGPADWVDRMAQGALAQIGTSNASKLWLGLAAYGYDWRISTTCPNGSTRSRKYEHSPAGSWSVYNTAKANGTLVRLTGQTTAAYRYDRAAAEYTFRYRQGDADASTGRACTSTREVWFQDGASHVVRARIAAKYHLGGVAMWDFGEETGSTWSRMRAAAPGIGPIRPSLLVTASTVVTAGTMAAITARVGYPSASALSGRPMAGVPVHLQWRAATGGTWRTLGTVRSGADGTVTFASAPGRNGTWRVVTDTATGRRAAGSGSVRTLVRPRFSVVASSAVGHAVVSVLKPRPVAGLATVSAARGSVTRISGRVLPAMTGQRVTLYRVFAGRPVAYASVTTTKTGWYGFVLPTKTAGTTRYRAASRSSVVYAGTLAPDLAVVIR